MAVGLSLSKQSRTLVAELTRLLGTTWSLQLRNAIGVLNQHETFDRFIYYGQPALEVQISSKLKFKMHWLLLGLKQVEHSEC